MVNEEDLFFKYQERSRILEELREDFERRKRKCEEKRERIQQRNIRERARMEELANTWGDCQDSYALLASFEESVEEQEQIQRKREEELQKEGHQIRIEMEHCDLWYEEERHKLAVGTEWE